MPGFDPGRAGGLQLNASMSGRGEKEYSSMIEQAFGPSGHVLKFPFVELDIMKMVRAAKAAISEVK